jgi:hypothetical protein
MLAYKWTEARDALKAEMAEINKLVSQQRGIA